MAEQQDFVRDHLEQIGFKRHKDADVDDALAVLKRVQNILLRQPGARAVDVGFRVRQRVNQFTDELAIRVHVDNKLDPESRTLITNLNFGELIGVKSEPKRPDTEEEGKDAKEYVVLYSPDRPKNSYRIDVVEARYQPSSTTKVSEPRLNNQGFSREQLFDLGRTRVHPLVGGVSVGNDLGQTGTLGAVVWDRTDGEPCLLSNWHVLAGSRTATRENRCFQPALLDGGTPDEDFVGHLKRGLFDRHGDAALASIESGRAYSPGEILGLWVPVAGTVEAKLGMPVRKWGRTTGFTEGFIDGVGFTVNLEYDGVGTQMFTDQVHISTRFKGEEVSAPGDSGAVWVTKYEPCDPNLRRDHVQGKARLVELAHDEPTQSQAIYEGDGKPPTPRVYFAVALHFAGDRPGSRSGEFAIATPLVDLARRLDFAVRPVFFPESGLVIKTGPAPPSASDRPEAPGTPPSGTPVGPAGGQGDPGSGPQPPGRRIPPP